MTDGMRSLRGRAGGPKPSSDQNSDSAGAVPAGFGAGGGACWAATLAGAMALPCQLSAASTGLTLGKSAGRSTHCTMVKVGR